MFRNNYRPMEKLPILLYDPFNSKFDGEEKKKQRFLQAYESRVNSECNMIFNQDNYYTVQRPNESYTAREQGRQRDKDDRKIETFEKWRANLYKDYHRMWTITSEMVDHIIMGRPEISNLRNNNILNPLNAAKALIRFFKSDNGYGTVNQNTIEEFYMITQNLPVLQDVRDIDTFIFNFRGSTALAQYNGRLKDEEEVKALLLRKICGNHLKSEKISLMSKNSPDKSVVTLLSDLQTIISQVTAIQNGTEISQMGSSSSSVSSWQSSSGNQGYNQTSDISTISSLQESNIYAANQYPSFHQNSSNNNKRKMNDILFNSNHRPCTGKTPERQFYRSRVSQHNPFQDPVLASVYQQGFNAGGSLNRQQQQQQPQQQQQQQQQQQLGGSTNRNSASNNNNGVNFQPPYRRADSQNDKMKRQYKVQQVLHQLRDVLLDEEEDKNDNDEDFAGDWNQIQRSDEQE